MKSSQPPVTMRSIGTWLLLFDWLLTARCQTEAVVVVPGNDAVLRYPGAQPRDTVISVEVKNTQTNRTVLVFRGQILKDEQHSSYVGRVDILEDGLSLKLYNVSHQDNGTYSWLVHLANGSRKEVAMQIQVVVASKPRLSLYSAPDCQQFLVCEARGWYPMPQLSWLGSDGGPPDVSESQGHLFNVRVNISAAATQGTTQSCVATVGSFSLTQEIHLEGVSGPKCSGQTDQTLAIGCDPTTVIVIATAIAAVVAAVVATVFFLGFKELWQQTKERCRVWARIKNGRRESVLPLLDRGESRYSVYGNVLLLETSGASQDFANANKLRKTGVKASEQCAERDLPEMEKYKEPIIDVARKLSVHPALIAAIISRQSRAGTALKADGFGKYDTNCYGLMQIHKHYHPVKGGPYSIDHIDEGTTVLIQAIKAIRRRKPEWTLEQQLKAGIAAYMCGPDKVEDVYEQIDAKTPYGDFANDVVARAKWFENHGFSAQIHDEPPGL